MADPTGESALVLERLTSLTSEAMLVCSPTGKIVRANRAFGAILGWAEADVLGRQVADLVHPHDMGGLRTAWRGRGAPHAQVSTECRWQHAGGGWVWLALSAYLDPELDVILAVGRDISRRRHAELVDRGQRTVLEAIAGGQPLGAILESLVRFVEREAPGAVCTVLTLDPSGTHIRVTAAPSAPASYNAALQGLAIGPNAGSCGTALFRRERVISSDIARDPLWTDYRALAEAHGFASCWSQPFFAPDGRVLGALAMYFRDPRSPAGAELPLLDAAANLAGIAVSGRQVARDLELAETAIAHLNDVVIISEFVPGEDAASRIVFVNQAFERLLGWSREEVLALPPGGLTPLITDVPAAVERRRRVRSGEALAVRARLKRRDGGRIVAEADLVPIRSANGEVTHSLTILRDVTAREAAEAELRRTQNIFGAILDAAPLVVWSMDRDGTFTRVEGRGLAATGFEAGALLGSSAVEFFRDVRIVGADGRERGAADVTAAVLDRGERVAGTVTFAGQFFEVAVGPLRGADGTIEGEVCVALLISDRVRLEAQLRHAQKMEAVGRLAGGVAHDFNNVLTAILGFATVALEETAPGGSIESSLMEIIAATRRAGDLTKRLLVFGRQQLLQPRSLELREVVATCEKLLVRLIGEDVHLEAVHAEPAWRVRADPSQLEQVVMNLAVNARDAMPLGGTLRVVTGTRVVTPTAPAPDAHVPPGSWVTLEVSDTGVGMDEAVLSRVFEPFFTTKAPGRGSGLGLSTVYGIITQSGGHVGVTSAPGAGTAFRVYLPREERELPVPEVVVPQSRPGSGHETVLIAEDDKLVRDLIRLALSRFGYRCLVAASGEEALTIASEHDGPLPLLVTDVVMPRMSGPQLRDRLLAIRPETRVLFLSGYTDDEMIKRGVLEDGVQFLQKPFPPDVLARKIREILDAP
jgi:PAS domain S-box-containing protein